MVFQLNEALDEVISVVKNSSDYKKCLELKEKLAQSSDVNLLVTNIKRLQKEYVKTSDLKIKEELDEKIKRLEEIPIYNIYMKYLEKVNEMIDIIRERLNCYFDNLLNEETIINQQFFCTFFL